VRAHDFKSVEQDLSLAFSFSLCHPIQEITAVAYSSSSTYLDFHWFLVDELMFIGDADSSSSLMVFFFQWRGGELFFFVASRLDGRGWNLIDNCMKASSSIT
jgi:hypothetical protein